jgi:hypothetical protein
MVLTSRQLLISEFNFVALCIYFVEKYAPTGYFLQRVERSLLKINKDHLKAGFWMSFDSGYGRNPMPEPDVLANLVCGQPMACITFDWSRDGQI